MWPIPKKYFGWREPMEFHQEMVSLDEARAKWWHKPVWLTAWIGLLLILRWVNILLWEFFKLDPGKRLHSIKSTIMVAAAMGLIFIYGIPWLSSRVQAKVVVLASGIFRTNGCCRSEWKFNKIASFDFQTGASGRTLRLNMRNGSSSSIGVSADVDEPALREFLQRRCAGQTE
jgi:hypothetical protein